MKINRLDRNGHTTIVDNIEAEFAQLMKDGYAMFLDDVQIKALPTNRPDAEILALAPLVGG